MDKLAAYEMLLEDHPLWNKLAGWKRSVRIMKAMRKKNPTLMTRGDEIESVARSARSGDDALEKAFVRAGEKVQRSYKKRGLSDRLARAAGRIEGETPDPVAAAERIAKGLPELRREV
jgi:hypothetical protein